VRTPEFLKVLLSQTYYVVPLLATVLVLGSYVVITLYSLWIGNIDILIPIKVSFVLVVLLYIGYSLLTAVTTIIRREWNKALFYSIGMALIIVLVTSFLDRLREFVFGREALINLTILPMDVKLLSSIGLILPVIFIGCTIVYFVAILKFFSLFAELFVRYLKGKGRAVN